MNETATNASIQTRIRRTTRRKLVYLAQADGRTPVAELDWMCNEQLAGRNIDPGTLAPVAAQPEAASPA